MRVIPKANPINEIPQMHPKPEVKGARQTFLLKGNEVDSFRQSRRDKGTRFAAKATCPF